MVVDVSKGGWYMLDTSKRVKLECTALSPVSGLYMKYAYNVRSKNRPAYIFCSDLTKVRAAWNFLHNRFPKDRLCVHRIPVVDDVDNQILRKNSKDFTKEECVV